MSGKQEVKQDLIAGFHDQKLASSVVPCPDKLPDLVVSKITFHDNYVVERDTLGDFPKPEWDMSRAADEQSPVCYRRGATVRMTVELIVLGTRSYEGSVTVQGSARIGDTDVTWSQDVTLQKGDATITLSQVAGSAPLPDRVGCYDPVVIAWEARPSGKASLPIGTSQHVLYALLGVPITVVYWTCIDVSCRWGHGATDDATLVERVFAGFKTRKLTRKRDGRGLSYWVPESPRVLVQTARCTAVNTWGLLHSKHGRGQCGSWAEFLLDNFRVHGVEGKKIFIYPLYGWVPGSANPPCLLVKNWTYQVPPPTSPSAFTHEMFTKCVLQTGVPGQRNANPPAIFQVHFITKLLGKYYDPAYGAGPLADQHEWESKSIDGLMRSGWTPWLGGFVGSSSNVTKFDEVNQATGARTADEVD